MSSSETNFCNPQNLPLEKIKISVKNEGVVREYVAIDAHWSESRQMTVYIPPPSGPKTIIGSSDAWRKQMDMCKNDLKCLLKLEYHRFWSTMVHNPSALDMLVSFLQEAHPPYMPPYEDPRVNETYQEIRKFVLVVFCRLATNKESKTCHMSKDFMRQLLYDNFIFTIPIIWDICLVYGADNTQTVTRLLESVFTLQPEYLKDLFEAIKFVKEAFKYIILLVNKDYESDEPPNLPDTFKGFTDFAQASSSSKHGDKQTFSVLRDLVIHLLDTAMTIKLFIETYPNSVEFFIKGGIVLSIVQLYEYAIPSLYEKLEELTDDTKTLVGHIDCARAQLLDIYREILAYQSHLIFTEQGNVSGHVENYLALMMDCLSERLFIRDYNACYPVQVELDTLRQAYPNLDTVKTDFILQAIYTNMEETEPDLEAKTKSKPTQNGHFEIIDNPQIIPTKDSEIPQSIREESLINEVKDILPELGEGFVLKCLQHYGFNCEIVINSILENNLAEPLRKLDRSLPLIPEDPLDTKFLETGIDRLNVFDNDEFDVIHRDDVDLSKIHKGKKKSKYKDLKDMLNDKTEVRKMADIYSKYNLVCDTEDYSDEYDDTYDDEGGAPKLLETVDDLGRPFVTPRILAAGDRRTMVEEESDEEPERAQAQPQTSEANAQRNRMDFCQNPEEVRARREASWRLKQYRGGHRPPPTKSTDVVGKAKGQGQEKEVLHNRDKKEKTKSSRGNHSRRSGAQWKRSQGMVPS